jgi:hypothetical protein
MGKLAGNTICCLCGDPIDLTLAKGDRGSLTREHVPPRQFFPKELRETLNPNLQTVPSHLNCNEASRKDEEYFFHAMAIHVVGTRPVMGQIILNDLKRRTNKPQTPAMVRKLLAEARTTTQGGIILPAPIVELSFDLYRLEQVALKVAQCVYYLEHEVYLRKSSCRQIGLCQRLDDVPGRLHSHSSTASFRITNSGLVSKQAGILFIPVTHEGNSQCCDEETEVIEQVVHELLGCQVYEKGNAGPRKLSLEDILLVAPFNMQVRMLKKKLGLAAKVGSVDKFQGQEAHVVIVSMCSSTLEDSPRGAEFLLDPNRLNVAVSRAKTLAIVVGNPNLVAARCGSVREMELANLFCWLVEYSRNGAAM